MLIYGFVMIFGCFFIEVLGGVSDDVLEESELDENNPCLLLQVDLILIWFVPGWILYLKRGLCCSSGSFVICACPSLKSAL